MAAHCPRRRLGLAVLCTLAVHILAGSWGDDSSSSSAPPPEDSVPPSRKGDDDAAGDDDDGKSGGGGDPGDDDDAGPSFVQGYVFVVVIALVLFCGCACLSANSIQTVNAPRGPTRQNATNTADHASAASEDRFVTLRDSLVESGETVWVCFICAYENKPRAQSCALCGASAETTRAFDDRLRSLRWTYSSSSKRRSSSDHHHGARPSSDAAAAPPSRLHAAADDDPETDDRQGGSGAPSPQSTTSADEDSSSSETPQPQEGGGGGSNTSSSSLTGGLSRGNNNTTPAGVRVEACPPLAEGRLSEHERAHAFTIGRLNELTLRQKGAARRRVWRRRRRTDGTWCWVREKPTGVLLSAHSSRGSLAYVSRLEPADSSDDDEAASRYDVRWSILDESASAGARSAGGGASPRASRSSGGDAPADSPNNDGLAAPLLGANERSNDDDDVEGLLPASVGSPARVPSGAAAAPPRSSGGRPTTSPRGDDVGRRSGSLLLRCSSCLPTAFGGGGGTARALGGSSNFGANAANHPPIQDSSDLEAVAASPFRVKQAWFERRVRAEELRPVTLEVRRSHVIADSVRRFEHLGKRRLARAPLRVRFRGEAAVDAGGVVREWYEIVAKELFAADLGLFEARREAGYAANLNPSSAHASYVEKRRAARVLGGTPAGTTSKPHKSDASSSTAVVDDDARLLRFAGRFVAKALRDRVALPVTLALPLLKHVLGVPLSFSDLEFVDADAFQSYAWLRDNDPAPLALSFAVDDPRCSGVASTAGKRPPAAEVGGDALGDAAAILGDDDDDETPPPPPPPPQTHALVPNGAEIEVDEENKAEFLALVLKFRVLDAIRPQLVSFLRGVDDVVDRFGLLAVFDYQELQLLVGGVADIDVDDWRRHTRYLGAFSALKETHPVAAMFWHCVESFDQTDRARLCQFVTASSQLPPSGFKALIGDDGRLVHFTLSSLPRSLGLWPRAHTCFNRLDLPLYKSYEELHSYLSLTIRLEITGFSME